MTNLEKFEDKIKLIIYSGNGFAVREHDGEVVGCCDAICSDCKFYGRYGTNADCYIRRAKWLQEEYEEPKEPEVDWTKVAVDTPILVSKNGEDWYKRYFAEYKDNTILAFDNGSTSWNAYSATVWRYAKLAEQEEQEK